MLTGQQNSRTGIVLGARQPPQPGLHDVSPVGHPAGLDTVGDEFAGQARPELDTQRMPARDQAEHEVPGRT
ncbi:hypothetical protein SDC9_96494 [bioreactor metagenome]|uniref:Uncharacterized protein n=1 Tax=bioreactor metagenome TaxID=1076179 RepID=A0A645AG16_9ZZZZ